MSHPAVDYIRFIAEYDDGRKHEFAISSRIIQRTDSIARLIARDRQVAGELPPGHINRVRRVVPLSNRSSK